MGKIRHVFKNIISTVFVVTLVFVWVVNTPIVLIGYVIYVAGKFLTFQYVNEYFDRYEVGSMLTLMADFHYRWIKKLHIKTLKTLGLIENF